MSEAPSLELIHTERTRPKVLRGAIVVPQLTGESSELLLAGSRRILVDDPFDVLGARRRREGTQEVERARLGWHVKRQIDRASHGHLFALARREVIDQLLQILVLAPLFEE